MIVDTSKLQDLYEVLDSIENDSNLVAHAKRELPNSHGDEMQEVMNKHVIRLIKLFSLEGHSGFSASYATAVIEKLLRFEPLRPLTGDESEWCYLDYDWGDMVAQNTRCVTVFLRKDGTAYDINGKVFCEPDGCCYTSSESIVEVTFPYTPKKEYVQVDYQEE